MLAYFQSVAGEVGEDGGQIEVLGRQIPTLRQSRDKSVLWFDFAGLCGGPRSQNDYLDIAATTHTVLLSGVPAMSPYQSAEARRFTWLVDVFYENKTKLIITAECAAEQLYTEGAHAGEFSRTVSRLTDMRSREYFVR
jgi:cell division protein ZapE